MYPVLAIENLFLSVLNCTLAEFISKVQYLYGDARGLIGPHDPFEPSFEAFAFEGGRVVCMSFS